MKVVILTEGGRTMGFGHVTRCIALYQAFKEFRLKPQLFINGDNTLKTILARGRIKIFDWLTDISKTRKLLEGTNIAIIDSYLAGLDFLKKIVPMVKIPVYIDDYKRLDYPPGVIINPNIHGKSIRYPVKRKRKYMLGPKYILLRKEFWNVLKKRCRNKTLTVTVTLGGQDIRMLTLPILKLLIRHYPNIQKIIIVNSPGRNFAQLKKLKDIKTKIIVNADARSFKNMLAISDIAISGAGQTTNELARMGVPTISICLAKNQEYILQEWQKRGFLLSAGAWNDKDLLYRVKGNLDVLLKNRSLRLQKSLVGRQTLDGKGARRIAGELKAMATSGADFREPFKILF
jgi:spore coat polysaccharide biosynthesis predicted glycosyltransferase SpsG